MYRCPASLGMHLSRYHLSQGISVSCKSLCNVLCSTGKPDKHWPIAHRSECGLPSEASLNCLVSPSSRELRCYPISLDIQYLVVPSLAVHSTCLFFNVGLTIITLGAASSTVYCLIIISLSVRIALFGVST